MESSTLNNMLEHTL